MTPRSLTLPRVKVVLDPVCKEVLTAPGLVSTVTVKLISQSSALTPGGTLTYTTEGVRH